MWSRDALVPPQLATAVMWLFVTLGAWFAALLAWGALVILTGWSGVGGDVTFAISLVHGPTIVLVAGAMAAAVGLAAVSGRTSRERVRRFFAAAALAAAVALAVLTAAGLMSRAGS